jgi:hypothetical protein
MILSPLVIPDLKPGTLPKGRDHGQQPLLHRQLCYYQQDRGLALVCWVPEATNISHWVRWSLD